MKSWILHAALGYSRWRITQHWFYVTVSGTQGKKQPSTSGVDVAARIMHSWKPQLWFQGWESHQEENKAHFTVGLCIFSSFKSKKSTQPPCNSIQGEQHLLHCLGAGLHGQRKSSTECHALRPSSCKTDFVCLDDFSPSSYGSEFIF